MIRRGGASLFLSRVTFTKEISNKKGPSAEEVERKEFGKRLGLSMLEMQKNIFGETGR